MTFGNEIHMKKHIIPQHLSIKAFRDNGYKDAAHALAELIDNSIQAGEQKKETTEVEVLCLDREEFINSRTRNRLFEIAVLDNACGMNAETLEKALQFGNGTRLDDEMHNGIGKYGVGLPNSSISQCKRVDVYTWQNGNVLHSYLDVDEIQRQNLTEVPEPKKSSIPAKWKKMARQKIGASGTLVVWSNLDRVRWKGAKALLENAEAVVGRMYRYFINDGKARIRLAYFHESQGGITADKEWDVRTNDPLYLMTNTSAPSPYDQEPAFDLVCEEPIDFDYHGKKSTVIIKCSVTNTAARKDGGSSPIGKSTAKNQGVSIVRSRRELQLNRTFDDRSNPLERWWGIEVQFSPSLDEVFGVTNNKQDANAFYKMDLEQDAELEGMTPVEYQEYLQDNQDPRYIIYTISAKIDKALHTIREQIKRMKEGSRSGGKIAPHGSAEEIASKATKARREKYGNVGESDKYENLPAEERIGKIAPLLVENEGLSQSEAELVARQIVDEKVKFIFTEAPLSGSILFDIKSQMGGPIAIIINSSHPARDHFFELLKNSSSTETDSPALKGLKLLFSAWARLEDEASSITRKQQFEDLRLDWGKIAREFINGIND
jgi:hypothetical protein